MARPKKVQTNTIETVVTTVSKKVTKSKVKKPKVILEFKDLTFETFETFQRARLHFENGYGCSIVASLPGNAGTDFSTPEMNYEFCVLVNDDLCFTTPITDSVIGYCNAESVTEFMKEVQALPKYVPEKVTTELADVDESEISPTPILSNHE